MIPGITITAAVAGDAPAIASLLREADLPHEDFAPHLAHFLVARDLHGAVVGAIGAEVYTPDALLRSWVVAPIRRGAGLGGALFKELDRAADRWGVECWWLLTTTAENFFGAQAFRATPREAAPATIAATAEFRGLCPAAATCWSRERKRR